MNIETKLFKWIGGKKWLKDKLNDKFNSILVKGGIKYYAEPFCGSLGSVIGSIETLQKGGVEKIYLNDINSVVINLFKLVRDNPTDLYKEFVKFETEHISLMPNEVFTLNKTKDKLKVKLMLSESEKHYNRMRVRFNQIKKCNDDILECSGLFLFLMDRCFNAVYRENSKGLFNSPYGWNNNKLNVNNKRVAIEEFSKFFNKFDVEFSNLNYLDFINSLKEKQSETLFYFDPPYLNESIKENNYSSDSFGLKDQNQLLDSIRGLDNIVYSNHDLPVFTEFFTTDRYQKEIIYRKNIISADNTDRSKGVAEILITSL